MLAAVRDSFDRRRSPVRVLHYSHDSYGLGHLRRTLTIAAGLHASRPDVTQLIVSGAADTLGWTLPPGVDWVKLPSAIKVGAGEYRARALDCDFGELRDLRAELLLAAARSFRPHVAVIDHVPAGLEGEALPALSYLHSVGTPLVLGLRDVVDDPALVRRSWRRQGLYRLLDELYDRILVYGAPELHEVATEYGFSPRARAKTRYVGFLGAPRPQAREVVRSRLRLSTGRFVLVTAGGGGDGFPLLRTMVDALRTEGAATRDFDVLLVAGPLMPERDRAELERMLPSGDARVRLVASLPELHDVLAAADAVVSMGGYNTTREILTYRRPAVVVPRVWPRLEQLVRAQGLARLGLVNVLHPAELTSARLLSGVREVLARGVRSVAHVPLDGVDRFADEIEELLLEHGASPVAERALAHA